jgi:hypothetical protein
VRYRALDSSGDYSFGRGQDNFLVDQPETVAQAIRTRLLLMTGEWFLDVTEGTPYTTDVVGEHTQFTYDAAIQSRVTETPGVLQITTYTSSVVNRALSIDMTVDTIYGPARLSGLVGSDGTITFMSG